MNLFFMAVNVQEIPIIFIPKKTEHTDNEYMIDQSTVERWNIDELKKFGPIYLYQPDVEPSPEGGQVKAEKYQSEKKKAYIATRRQYQAKVEQQPFVLVSNDNREFQAESISNSDFAFFVDCKDHYEMHLVDSTFSISEQHKVNERTLDAVENEAKIRKKRRDERMKAFTPERIETLKLQKKERKIEAELESNQANSFGVKTNDDEDDDGLVDVDVERSDDSGPESDFTPEPVSSPSDDSSDSLEFFEEEEEEPKEKEANEPMADENMTTEEIVDVILPDMIKKEEIINFFQDVGLVRYSQIQNRFKAKLKCEAQQKHFKKLLKDCCVIKKRDITKDGKEISYLGLKPDL